MFCSLLISIVILFVIFSGQAVDSVVVSYLRDMVYELADASFYSSKFTYVIKYPAKLIT